MCKSDNHTPADWEQLLVPITPEGRLRQERDEALELALAAAWFLRHGTFDEEPGEREAEELIEKAYKRAGLKFPEADEWEPPWLEEAIAHHPRHRPES